MSVYMDSFIDYTYIREGRVRVRSANFSKPTIGSSTIHTVAVNAPTTGSGAKDS